MAYTISWNGSNLDLPLYGVDLNGTQNEGGINTRKAILLSTGQNLYNAGGSIRIVSINKTQKTIKLDVFVNGLGRSDNELTLSYVEYSGVVDPLTYTNPSVEFEGGETLRNENDLTPSGTLSYRIGVSILSVPCEYYIQSITPTYSATTMNFGDLSVSVVYKNFWGETHATKSYPLYIVNVQTVLDTSNVVSPVLSSSGINTTQAKFYLTSGNCEIEIPNSDLDITISPEIDTTKEQTYLVSMEAEYQDNYYVSSYRVVGLPQLVSRVEHTYSDTSYYYDTWVKTFNVPTFNFVVYYNDGTNETVSSSSSIVKFYNDADCTKQLTSSVVVSETDRIYCRLTHGEQTFVFSYPITVNEDKVASIVVNNAPTLTRYRKPSDYSFSITATHKDGRVVYAWHDYIIENANAYITSSGTATLYFIEASKPSNKVSYSFSVAEPQIDHAEITNNGDLKTAINNGKSPFDITKTKLTIFYKDSVGLLDYKTECSYATTLANAKYTVSVSDDDFTPLDGSEPIELTFAGSKKVVVLSFLAKSDILNDTATCSVNVSVVAITALQYINYGNTVEEYGSCFKTEYRVGETFLGADDLSNINVGYLDADNSVVNENFMLNSSNSILNIYPIPGTKLTSTGSYQVTVRSVWNTSLYVQYQIKVSTPIEYTENTEKLSLKPWKLASSLTYRVGSKTITFSQNAYVLVEGNNIMLNNGVPTLNGTLASGDDGDGIKVYGYLKNVNDTSSAAVVVLFHDYISPVSGDSNISVKFPCYDATSSDFVNKCHFGVRFGHNNSLNRLFLSGNTEKPNMDIHSDEPNWSNDSENARTTEGDFSYFPDTAIKVYGESENAICGYDVVSDSKLLVLKTKSGKERSIYFVNPITATMINSSGVASVGINGNTLTQEEYAKYGSNSPIAGISPKTIGNFNGDTLFVSNENNLVGLDIEGIVGDSQRQANTRSAYIDPRLKKIDLENSLLFTTGEYCLLSTEEALFATHRNSYNSETNNYEWWALNPTNANTYFESEKGNIYYGTENGSLYVLKKGQYQDTERYFLGTGTSEVYILNPSDNGSLTVSSELASKLDNKFKFRQYENLRPQDNFYERLCDIGEGMPLEKHGNFLCFKNNPSYLPILERLIEGQDYFFCNPQTNVPIVSGQAQTGYRHIVEYKLRRLTIDEVADNNLPSGYLAYFALSKKVGTATSPVSGITSVGLACRMVGEYDISSVEGTTLKLSKDGKPVYVATMYLPNNADKTCELTKYTNIVSEFISAPFGIDTPNYNKSVLKLDLINSTLYPSDLSVALMSNKTLSDPTEKVVAFNDDKTSFSLEDLSFTGTTFDKNIVPSAYTVKRFFPRQRFWCIAFISNNAKNSVLPGIDMTYTINGFAKGSD